MTREQLISELKEVIVKAVPEIMELKFGCIIEVIDRENRKESHKIYKARWSTYNDIVPSEMITCCGRYITTSAMDGRWYDSQILGGWRILGRPISLCDVLIAIKTRNAKNAGIGIIREDILSDDNPFSQGKIVSTREPTQEEIDIHDENSWDYFRSYAGDGCDPWCTELILITTWNLRKDSLTDQSLETLQWLHSIFCTKP